VVKPLNITESGVNDTDVFVGTIPVMLKSPKVRSPSVQVNAALIAPVVVLAQGIACASPPAIASAVTTPRRSGLYDMLLSSMEYAG